MSENGADVSWDDVGKVLEDTASATDHTIWYAVRFALANPFLSYSSVRFHQPRTLCEISYEVLSLLNDLTFLCFLSCFDFSMVKR